MKYNCLCFLFFLFPILIFSQNVDSSFSQEKMRKDLKIFKSIRIQVNSGIYKYRTKQEIDSIYSWADKEILKSLNYRQFYNIISLLTDFEGSLHNDTYLSKKSIKKIRLENYGYFPFPIKLVEGRWIINIKNKDLPLGSELLYINGEKVDHIIQRLYKYYTTDGYNITGKQIGINTHFPKYYRLDKGLNNSFKVVYKEYGSDKPKCKIIKGIGYMDYYQNFKNRFSKPFDDKYYKKLKNDEKYSFKIINSKIGVLTINTFSLGDNSNSIEHLKYKSFLDSTFLFIKENKINDLIVDIRNNGGGTDPNDILTYSYLAKKDFSENKSAWISFNKIPLLRYYNSKLPVILRPLFVNKYNKIFHREFPDYIDGKFYENENSEDHKLWKPNENAFTGKIYLLINPAVASAASLFASLVANSSNTIIIGEETMGGYYGHNGHTKMEYKLPNSKIITSFSIVNLEQDVSSKKKQIYGRGVIPDYNVFQSYKDYLNQKDTQLNFTLDLIQHQ